jgi:hypothetical protein
MRQTLIILLAIGHAIAGYSQHREFTRYSNGLIYDDTTMVRLKFIVDSLHLKYKKCDLTQTYYSIPQTSGYGIYMDTGNIEAALADIEKNISIEAFAKKYPLAVIDSGALILFDEEYNEYFKKIQLVYNNVTYGASRNQMGIWKDHFGRSVNDDGEISGVIGRWAFQYAVPGKWAMHRLEAMYMSQPPVSSALPERYAKLVLYADCMVDTNAAVLFKDAKCGQVNEKGELEDEKPGRKYLALKRYLEKHTDHIHGRYADNDTTVWYSYDSLRWQYIIDTLAIRREFKPLVKDAIEEALQLKYYAGEWLEFYAERYYSKHAALTLKRNREVVGRCSRDDAPRVHTFNIALLAAETANWPVFLHAHLDIMNDYAARSFNSSYAQRERKTYIKEIEELNIDVQSLMLGISLRVRNVSDNHYFGSPGRLGRAFAETKKRVHMEQAVLSMITDTTLDDLNRLAMHYLFLNYIYYLPKKEDRMAGLDQLEAADKKLPAYLLPHLHIYRDGIEKGGEEEL